MAEGWEKRWTRHGLDRRGVELVGRAETEVVVWLLTREFCQCPSGLRGKSWIEGCGSLR